eukprot:scaffold69891_cov61-Phaeocystis_antarctica.AAC.3
MGTRRSKAAPRMLSVALVMWGELGRGWGHTPRVTLRNIGGGHCEELLLRQKHSGHVVAEAHLTVVRAVGRELRKADGSRDEQSAARGGGTHLLRRRDSRAGALLEPGADIGEQPDLVDGDVGLAHALVAQPKLLAAAACRSRR